VANSITDKQFQLTYNVSFSKLLSIVHATSVIRVVEIVVFVIQTFRLFGFKETD